MNEDKGILEVIALVDDVAAALKAAKADGTIDWRDALRPETRALVPALLLAAKDGKLLPDELKNLTGDQISDLLLKGGEAIGHLVEALVA